MSTLIFSALLVLSPAASEPAPDRVEVQVSQQAEDRYTLTVTLAPEVPVELAQQSLQPVADQVCQGRAARMGTYRFNIREPMDAASGVKGFQVFEQELQCGGEDTADRGTPAPSTPPSTDDERWITEQSLIYLAAMDDGDSERVLSLEDPQALSPIEPGRLVERARFGKTEGPPIVRRVLRLTWYDDPQGAPKPGRYVAADYSAEFRRGAFYCGYLLWYLMPDGQFRIMRAEHGQFESDQARTLPPDQLPAVRRQLACRD